MITPWEAGPIRGSLGAKQGHGKNLPVGTGVAIIDRLGVTITIPILGGVTLRRHLYVHGRAITQDKPRYMEQTVVVHALRVLRDWLKETAENRQLVSGIAVSAGDIDAIISLKTRPPNGQLDLKSVAASGLIDDIKLLRGWNKWHMIITQYGLRKGDQGLRALPRACREVLRVAEVSRSIPLPLLGDKWSKDLPEILATKEEFKHRVDARHQRDEWTAQRRNH